MNLDAYLARIGYEGSRAPTAEVLAELSHAHVKAIPFENLDVILGRAIDLELPAIEKKLVEARRGGYCFEQNALFHEVLCTLGFDAKLLSARVRIGRPRDYTPARTHTFLRVDIGGAAWLADVGVGAASLSMPLRFGEDGVEQATHHESRRLVRENGVWFHQIRYGDEWSDVYELTGEEMPFIDRVVGNWYTSMHPRSHFRDRVMVSLALSSGRRVTLVNRELTTRNSGDGSAQKVVIGSLDEYRSVLHRTFAIEIEASALALAAADGTPTLLGRLLAF